MKQGRARLTATRSQPWNCATEHVQGNANMAVQIIADRSADSIPHKIQIFSGGCKICKDTIGIVEIGKCRSCKMEVLDVASKENARLVKRYNITAVPSIVI